MLIYLHGFRSSPQSHKAVQLATRMAERGCADQFWCEQLSHEPLQAIAQAETAINTCRSTGSQPLLVGSSLGGFYATVLAERHGLHAVLVNPYVPGPGFYPQRFIGEHDNFHSGQRFVFTQAHADQISALDPARIDHPQHLWLLAEEADEVLDTRLAIARYAGARQTILSGGDHGFTRWADYLDEIVDFHTNVRMA